MFWRERSVPWEYGRLYVISKGATLTEATDAAIQRWEKKHGKRWTLAGQLSRPPETWPGISVSRSTPCALRAQMSAIRNMLGDRFAYMGTVYAYGPSRASSDTSEACECWPEDTRHQILLPTGITAIISRSLKVENAVTRV